MSKCDNCDLMFAEQMKIRSTMGYSDTTTITNEEWQEMIRKNVAEHTVLSPAHIKIIKNEKTGSILVIQKEAKRYEDNSNN